MKHRSAQLAMIAIFLALVAVQARYSWLSTAHVLDEELSEAVRSPFWLTHHLVYDGMSSNIGWYAVAAATYRAFGFSLFAAKAVRVLLTAVSLACLGQLLVVWLGWGRAIVPFAAFGLSPAYLYFNTMMASYGIDLQCMPVAGWLLWRSRQLQPGIGRVAAHVVIGTVVMAACLMWPVCVFYVPLVAGVIALRRGSRLMDGAAAAFGAILPFAAALIWLDNAGTWIDDPSMGSGVFRGGGNGHVGSLHAVLANAWWMTKDLTVHGTSYYFWLPAPDFSGVSGLMAVAAVAAALPAIFRAGREARAAVVVCVLFALVTGTVASIATGPPGIRRATTIIAAFYGLYALSWMAATSTAQAGRPAWAAKLQIALLSLLLVHHVVALPTNARSFAEPPPGIEHWFSAAASPRAALSGWIDAVARGRPLDCREVGVFDAARCRYSSIYSAIAWSFGQGDGARPVTVYDLRRGENVGVTPEGWPPSLTR